MKKLGFIVDTATGRCTDLAESPVELPEVVFGDTVLVIGWIRESLAAVLTDLDLTGATALRCHVKKDRLSSDTTTLTFQDAYNGGYAAAWEDLTTGKATWLVNFGASALSTELGSAEYVDLWLELSWLDGTGTIPQTLAQIPIRLVPQIDTGAAGTPPPATPTYLTAVEILAAFVAKATFDANTILKADTDDTPVALPVGASTIVGRKASGGIAALTAAEVLTILGLAAADQWTAWTNDDMDTGTEILVQWDAPTTNAMWKVSGIIAKAGNIIGFDAAVVLSCIDDGYGGYTRTVQIKANHTTEIGDCSPLSWEATPGAGDIYSDYDAGTGKIRLRLALTTDNWAASGKWLRVA